MNRVAPPPPPDRRRVARFTVYAKLDHGDRTAHHRATLEVHPDGRAVVRPYKRRKIWETTIAAMVDLAVWNLIRAEHLARGRERAAKRRARRRR